MEEKAHTAHANKPEHESQDIPGVIVLPPVIYLVFLLAGIGVEFLVPTNAFSRSVQFGMGGLLIALGLGINISTVRVFKKAGTEYHPTIPVTSLITTGFFRYSRNPLYMGVNLIYLGLGILLNNLWVLALFVPALVVMYYGVILREERYLEEKFGEAYRGYKNRVRRWF